MAKVTVVCPNCGSTGTYNKSFPKGSGTQPVQCRACRKGFKIHYRNGEVDWVKPR